MNYAVIVQFVRDDRVRYTGAICIQSPTIEGIEDEFSNAFYDMPIASRKHSDDTCWVTVFSPVGEFVMDFQL